LGDIVIEEARDGREALAAIAEQPPDLVLCNWDMPEMSGIAVLEALRREGTCVPLGFITQDRSELTRARALAAGACFLLSQPFASSDLQLAMQGGGVQTLGEPATLRNPRSGELPHDTEPPSW
jgi:two-component system chemotaxis response regulator CheY